ncbi:MAG TPA: ABC transporter substrate-binding protein [Acidimicrobiales bacterium]|nr:ABC transporter substrate-binding protein [Acidimicrobiales bacterium]
MRTRTGLVWLTAVALLGAACSGGDDDAGGGGGGGGGGDLPECPLDALDDATEPTEITLWHTMVRANEEALVTLTDAFNASQTDVKVNLVNNNDSNDQHEKYLSAISTGGELPDLVQSQEFYLQQLVDTQTVLPAQSCLDAENTSTEDFVDRTLAYYEIADVQWGLPFAVSEPILLYNRTAFTNAGLDPDNPPATFEDLRTAAQALVDAGHEGGLGLKLDAWHLEQMLAWQGEPFVNSGNGREERATEVAFDTDTAVETFAFLKGLVDDGLAITSPADGEGGFDNLLSVGTGKVGMTIDASGSLGTIIQVLESGQYADVEPAVAPVPGREDDGGVLVGGSGLYVSAQDPAKQAAAWRFAEFLTSAESQSQWAAATGFVPVRESATELPEVQQRWQEIPGFRVAYDELTEGAENDATAGPAIGDYRTVRRVVQEAEAKMYLEDMSPEDAVAEAAEKANDAISSYNSRI